MKTNEENLLPIANINSMLEILSINSQTLKLHKAGAACILLLNSSKKINVNSEPLIVNFYLETYKYYITSEELISNPNLLTHLNFGPEAAFMESFKFALKRQLELTEHIKNTIGKDPEQDLEYCEAFVNNLSFIRAQKNNITMAFSSFIRQTIAEYFLSYLEFLNDHGWTICFPEYNLFAIKVPEATPQTPALRISHAAALERNFEEFKLFFRECEKESENFHWGNKQSLENFLGFCNNIKFTANDKTIFDNDWLRLIDAIKSNRLLIIAEIVTTNPSIISIPYPNNFCDDDKNFTPLMIAAKYGQNEDVIKALLAPQETKKEKTNHITLRPTDSDEPINAYNSLMIAARWGSPAVFQYLLEIIPEKIKTLGNVKFLIECICFNYLPADKTLRNTLLNGLAFAILTEQPDYEKWLGEMPVSENIKEKIYFFQAVKLESLAPLLEKVSNDLAELEIPARPVRAFKPSNLAIEQPQLFLFQPKRKTKGLQAQEQTTTNESHNAVSPSDSTSSALKRRKH